MVSKALTFGKWWMEHGRPYGFVGGAAPSAFAAGRLAGLEEAERFCKERAKLWLKRPKPDRDKGARWAEASQCAEFFAALRAMPQAEGEPK